MTMLRSLMAVAMLSAAPASATTLLDGSFEIQGAALPVTNYCYNGQATPGGPACAAGAWGPGGGVIVTGSSSWGGTSTPAGSYYGFVQALSVVSQTFTATENGTGVLSWIDAGRSGNPGGGAQSYEVTLSTLSGSISLGTFTTGSTEWTTRTTSVFSLSNGETYTLAFNGLSQADNTAFIDAVGLTTTAVPEASTWAMLIAGFGMIGFAARRRRAVAA